MRKQAWTIGGRYMLPDFKIKQQKKQETIEDVLNALTNGGTVRISKPLDVTAVIDKPTTIKLTGGSITGKVFAESGGEMIEGTSDSYAIWVKEGGEITIEGKGEIVAKDATYSMAVWANGGKVTIKDGVYRNGGDGTDLIYASAGGSVYIYGGEFIGAGNTGSEPGTANKFSLLNIKDKDYKSGSSEIVVYGGKFHGFNPADNLSEGPGTNFVAKGYESIEIEPNVWEVRKIKSMIDSTKMYYGTIVSPKFKSFSELTEADVNAAIKAGTLKESSVKAMQTTVNIKNEDDAVVILIPSTKYKAYKDDGSGSNKIPFNEVNSGSNFHANGEVKLGKFSVFGEWYIVPGNLVIYVE